MTDGQLEELDDHYWQHQAMKVLYPPMKKVAEDVKNHYKIGGTLIDQPLPKGVKHYKPLGSRACVLCGFDNCLETTPVISNPTSILTLMDLIDNYIEDRNHDKALEPTEMQGIEKSEWDDTTRRLLYHAYHELFEGYKEPLYELDRRETQECDPHEYTASSLNCVNCGELREYKITDAQGNVVESTVGNDPQELECDTHLFPDDYQSWDAKHKIQGKKRGIVGRCINCDFNRHKPENPTQLWYGSYAPHLIEYGDEVYIDDVRKGTPLHLRLLDKELNKQLVEMRSWLLDPINWNDHIDYMIEVLEASRMDDPKGDETVPDDEELIKKWRKELRDEDTKEGDETKQ